jgi:hypothetical protein
VIPFLAREVGAMASTEAFPTACPPSGGAHGVTNPPADTPHGIGGGQCPGPG